MKTTLPIGFAAGVASALLYGSLASGSIASVLLFYLAPLPLYIAGLGWGLVSAGTGVVAAALLSLLFVGAKFSGLFLVWTGGPTLGLIYLALLSRGVDDDDAGTREWYPQGRILVWTCIIASILLAITIFIAGPDLASFQAYMRSLFERVIKHSKGFEDMIAQQPGFDVPRAVNFLIWVLPAVSVGIWTIATWANLWLGAVVARASGKLERPWPPFSEIIVPQTFAWAFLGGAGLAFLPGVFGLLAGAFATGAAVVFIMLGIVTLHAITAGKTYRPFLLGTAYALLIFLSWFAFPAFAALGLIDTIVGIRARYSGPPQAGNAT